MKVVLEDLKQLLMQPLIIKGFCICISLLIIYELVHGIIMDLDVRKITSQPIVRQIPSTVSTSVLPENLRGNLFGAFVDKNLNNSSIKSSLLKILLVGLVYSTDEKESEVIVHTAVGRDRVYHQGDFISGGVKIERITKDGMVVNRDGNLERILLPKTE